MTYRKKLIEVALPLEDINREAAREKSIRHWHPSTLQLWWARRPLAACRAVLFALQVDDPLACPEQFRGDNARGRKRKRLRSERQRGFRWHAAEKCYTRAASGWIAESESPFKREEHAAEGELVSHLWVTEQRLANGVEIAAEPRTLIRQQPATTTLVEVGDDHAPCALTGREILELKDSRQIMLHPARYRMVENQK